MCILILNTPARGSNILDKCLDRFEYILFPPEFNLHFSITQYYANFHIDVLKRYVNIFLRIVNIFFIL